VAPMVSVRLATRTFASLAAPAEFIVWCQEITATSGAAAAVKVGRLSSDDGQVRRLRSRTCSRHTSSKGCPLKRRIRHARQAQGRPLLIKGASGQAIAMCCLKTVYRLEGEMMAGVIMVCRWRQGCGSAVRGLSQEHQRYHPTHEKRR